MITVAIAEKLLKLAAGEQLPASSLKHAIIDELISDGIIASRMQGRTKSILYITDAAALDAWLYNSHSIQHLGDYIRIRKNETALRSDLIQVANDSKTKNIRTYKGFLVNSYIPIECTLHGLPFTVHPVTGTFHFVYDFEAFIPRPDTVIIGIENMENFRYIAKQSYLFEAIKPLFVCRYPQVQSKDVIKWLAAIPNSYIHFGDFDFAGINIYLTEYKKQLLDRAAFFTPPNIEDLLVRYGNPKLYDQQQLANVEIAEHDLHTLISLLHKHKKGLEQEALLIL